MINRGIRIRKVRQVRVLIGGYISGSENLTQAIEEKLDILAENLLIGYKMGGLG